MSTFSGLRTSKLKTEADWQQCKNSLSIVQDPKKENPWANWDHYYFVAHQILVNSEYWLIEVLDKGEVLAACVFREEDGKRMGMKFKTLRSLDWATMCVPPFITREGCEEKAYEILANNLKTVSRTTGADLLCLYQQRKRYCKPLMQALKSKNVVINTREMSNSQIIDTRTFKDRVNLKKRLKVMRKNEEKLEKDFGIKPQFTRYRGDVIDELYKNGLWQQFKRLWDLSWQKGFIAKDKEELGEESFKCFADPVERWSRKGWLDFCVLTLGDKALTAYLNVCVNGEVDLLTTVYDPEFEDYGVGTINLTRVVLDSVERQDRCLDFGGEAVSWKRRWSTNEAPILLHEIPLKSPKSILWSVKQKLDQLRLKDSRVEFHNIQSKKEFINLVRGKKQENLHEDENFIVKALKTDEDWLSIRNDVEKFENKCGSNPWQNFKHCYNFWKSFHSDKTCWMLAVSMPEGRSKGWLACGFFLEQFEKRKKVNFKILRSLDQMAMRISPFTLYEGMEREATRAILHCLNKLGKRSGADLLALYRLDTIPAEILLEELNCMNVPHKAAIFTFSKYAILPDDFAEYSQYLGKKIIYKVRRAFNQPEKHFGEKPQVIHFSDKKRSEEFDWMWSEFERLRENSWQYENAEAKGLVNTSTLTEYFRIAIDDWIKAGMVQLTLITLKGGAVSGLLSLATKQRSYGFLTAYDREYAKYSFGIAGLMCHLEEIHSRGIRNIEFGGEGSDWKNKWATGEDAIYQVEIGLGSPKSMLWNAINYIKKTDSEPVR